MNDYRLFWSGGICIVDINSLYKRPHYLRSQLLDFQIVLRAFNELLYILFLHIRLIDLLFNFSQFFLKRELLILIVCRERVISFRRNSADDSVLVKTAYYLVKLLNPLLNSLFVLLCRSVAFLRLGFSFFSCEFIKRLCNLWLCKVLYKCFTRLFVVKQNT